MHTVGKWIMGVGGVLLLGGVLMLISSVGRFSDMDSWAAEETTGTTLGIADDDGMGDIGLSFFVKADYTDVDGDGEWDHCQDFEITVTEKPDGGWDETDGDFYFQSSEDGERGCRVESGADKSKSGYAKVGHACFGCNGGDFQFESNQPVWVVYADDAIGDFFGGVLSGVGASSCLCCGLVIFVIGLVLGLTMEEKPATSFVVDQEGKVILNNEQTVVPDTGDPTSQLIDEGGGSEAVDQWYKQAED